MGKGLSALIPDIDKNALSHIQIDRIKPNPFQPRREFDSKRLKELSETIKKEGILEPVLLRETAEGYQIIAGERRVRAAKLAKMSAVPAIVKYGITDVQMAKFALIENLQREELTCVEQAEGYKKLIEKFGYSQRMVSEIVGVKRATVANLLRILNLPPEIIGFLQNRSLSLGHAKVLLSVSDTNKQIFLAKKAAQERLSVRALESKIKRVDLGKRKKRRSYQEYEKKLNDLLKLPVKINGNKITIKFNDYIELKRFMEQLSEFFRNC